MNILILGSTGKIGSYLMNYFSNLNRKKDNLYRIKGLSTKDFDLLNIDDLKKFIKKEKTIDALVFLVGLAHFKGEKNDYNEFKKINCDTLNNFLSTTKQYNKVPNKIIFASTISTYGEKYNQKVYSEDVEQEPFSPYAITKLEAENYLLRNFADKSWILRFSPIYSQDFLLNILRRTRIGKIPFVVGDGNKRLSLCNIENVSSIVEKIISEEIPKGIYNLSDPKDYTYSELLKWQNINWKFRIPEFLIKSILYFARLINNNFLKENSVKLISDNIYPSTKIREYINLQKNLYNIKFEND